jgi:hypothetical protein
VLPDRIELSTSPLPMECSTTELRQHARIRRIGPKGLYRRAVLATRTPLAQARGRVRRAQETRKNHPVAPACCFNRGNSGPIRFPVPRAPCRGRLQRANNHLGFDHFAGFVAFDAIGTPQVASCRSWRKTPAWRHEAEPAVQHPLRQYMWLGRRCILSVLNVNSNGPAMKDDQANRDRQIRSPAKDSRQDRLKLALRENLKRRKSQARGRGDAVGASSEDADASLDDGSGKEPGR